MSKRQRMKKLHANRLRERTEAMKTATDQTTDRNTEDAEYTRAQEAKRDTRPSTHAARVERLRDKFAQEKQDQEQIARKKAANLAEETKAWLQKNDPQSKKAPARQLQPGNAAWVKRQEEKREKAYEDEARLRAERHDRDLVKTLGPAWDRNRPQTQEDDTGKTQVVVPNSADGSYECPPVTLEESARIHAPRADGKVPLTYLQHRAKQADEQDRINRIYLAQEQAKYDAMTPEERAVVDAEADAQDDGDDELDWDGEPFGLNPNGDTPDEF
jgi:hypothetical protein